MSSYYTVRISPVFGQRQQMQDYLSSYGHGNFINFIDNKSHCLISYKTIDEAERLRTFLDQRLVGGVNISASIEPDQSSYQPRQQSDYPQSRSYPRREEDYRQPDYSSRSYPRRDEDYPPRRPEYRRDDRDDRRYSREPERDRDRPQSSRLTKTVKVTGYLPPLTRRMIWDDFHSIAFVKQIEVKDDIGYIQFGNENDTEAVLNYMNKIGNRLRDREIHVDCIPDRPLNIPRFVVPLIVEEEKTIDRVLK